MRSALAALEAAGYQIIDTRTHWAAPWNMTDAIHAYAPKDEPEFLDSDWAAMRDAYLAEQRAGKGEG